MLTIAHRGASGHAAENTLPAITLACRLGADRVEVDVRLSRDGVPVLLHDATLERTHPAVRRSGATAWSVADLHSDDLTALGVPTLAEALDLAPLLVELKDPDTTPGLVEAVADCVVGSDVVLQSFDVAAVRRLAALRPHVPRGVLGRPAVRDLREIASFAGTVGVRHRRLDPAYVAAAHAAGLQVLAWTVNLDRSIARVLRLGVDGVISDYPERVLAALATGRWCPTGSLTSAPSATSTLGSSALAVRR